MIDIETMASQLRQPMIQFAGVYFDPATKEEGQSLEICLDLNLLQNAGFRVDKDTLVWWLDQNTSILQDILMRGENPVEALVKIKKFAKDAKYIWSHSTFDFVILQNHLKVFNLKPLGHKKQMDINTLVKLSGINTKDYDWTKKTHDALDDCVFQIQYVSDAIQKIGAEF